MKENKFQ